MRPARSWQINQALLLYGPQEAQGARAMRLSGREERETDEMFVSSQLLLPELTGLSPLAQAILVVEAGLFRIPTSITNDLKRLTMAETDELIAKFQHGTTKQKHDVLVALASWPQALSDSAWAWVAALSKSSDPLDARLAFIVLAAADPVRFGRDLDGQGWCFVPGTDTTSAHVASGALFTATASRPFEQIAARIAPWRLLEAVHYRGGDASETRVAAEYLDAVLAGGPQLPIEMGARLTVERQHDTTEPPWYSVRPLAPTDPHSAEAFHDKFDFDAQVAAQERAGEFAQQAIQRAREEGASMFLEFITRNDGLAICRHAPDVVQQWIAGHEARTPDFIRRVEHAEGLFLSICEALLAIDPKQGVSLWVALSLTLRTRILGPAKLPELLHILFRAPSSESVEGARDSLLDVQSANTDSDLYELALACELNDQQGWLERHIAADADSDRPWRQRRASVLAGFRIGNALPVPDAWPEGPSHSWAEDVERRSARLQYYEACARHWWSEYWRCDDIEGAYAAWVLFDQCADRRAVAWMDSDAARSPNSTSMQDAKHRHWRANRLSWKGGAEHSRLQLNQQFLRRNIEGRVWPWRNLV
jgi:hypothetical protein